jgi:hypothetical protein
MLIGASDEEAAGFGQLIAVTVVSHEQRVWRLEVGCVKTCQRFSSEVHPSFASCMCPGLCYMSQC